ncbi:MAG: thioredoxin family protein [Bacteroidota bacterium]
MRNLEQYGTLNGEEATELIRNLNGQPLVLSFAASWAGMSEVMDNYFRELALKYSGKVRFARVDVDKSKQFANSYGIRKVPTFIIFYEGEITDHFEGAVSRTTIIDTINTLI